MREERSGGVGPGEYIVVHDNCAVIPDGVSHAALKNILITHFGASKPARIFL